MAANYKKIITDKTQIIQLLTEQCLLQDPIEFFINNNTLLFCSRIVNELPGTIKDLKYAEFAKTYSPYSHLKQSQSILIEHPDTYNGDINLHKGDQLLIHFYTGLSSFETRVPLLQTVIIDGNPLAIEVGFPKQIYVRHTRNRLRAVALANSKIKVNVISPDMGNYNPQLREVSISGLSFCILHQYLNRFSIGNKVQLTLTIHDEVNLVVHGNVRHNTPVSTMQCCVDKPECDVGFENPKAICGIDFDHIRHSQELQINEIVYFIQREKLIKEKQDLIKFNKELESQVEEKTNQLREKDIQLLENDRAVNFSILASSVTKEFNNPINNLKILIAYVEKSVGKLIDIAKYWEEKPLPEPLFKEFNQFFSQTNFNYLITSLEDKFDSIKNWLETVVTIINNLQSFSESDKKSVNKIDINESIEKTIKLLHTGENVEFVYELQRIPPVECYPNDINHSLLQIIKNAIEAIDNNGVIRINSLYDEKENQAIVKIIDNGIGMSPDVLKLAFKPFFTTKSAGSGTGMALSIIEKIINRHGGKIDISSKKDIGTTVTMALPVKG